MSHLAAFLLRLAFAAAMEKSYVVGHWPHAATVLPPGSLRLLDAADAYDRPVIPIDAPAWLRWNCPGGEA